jgi:hypothetical protein
MIPASTLFVGVQHCWTPFAQTYRLGSALWVPRVTSHETRVTFL